MLTFNAESIIVIVSTNTLKMSFLINAEVLTVQSVSQIQASFSKMLCLSSVLIINSY